MEDYVLREINKIGNIIEAILLKVLTLKKDNYSEEMVQAGRSDLQSQLNLNIDNILADENSVNILINKYEFNDDNLEMLAELLFNFFIVTDDNIEKGKLKISINDIYKHLEKNRAPFPISRYYILQEINRVDLATTI